VLGPLRSAHALSFADDRSQEPFVRGPLEPRIVDRPTRQLAWRHSHDCDEAFTATGLWELAAHRSRRTAAM
jgi:hypothetical protein